MEYFLAKIILKPLLAFAKKMRDFIRMQGNLSSTSQEAGVLDNGVDEIFEPRFPLRERENDGIFSFSGNFFFLRIKPNYFRLSPFSERYCC